MAMHHGSCHCGAVQVDVDVDLENLMTCNCSLCGRSGAIMAFVPMSKVSHIQGEDHLTDYQFGKKVIHHSFCSICGMRPFARGEAPEGGEWAMINIRCLDGVDVHALSVSRTHDGRNR